MSEETTRHIPDPRSFEERVFARFDALDARLSKLEEESERRAVETKPIWERALAEILEVRQDQSAIRQDQNAMRQDIGEIKEVLKKLAKKVNVHSVDITELRADLSDHEDRLDKLEAEPTR